jgi:hypothetical protein
MSPPTDQERASSLRHAKEVTWTTAGDRAVAEDEVAAAWDTRDASTSRPSPANGLDPDGMVGNLTRDGKRAFDQPHGLPFAASGW